MVALVHDDLSVPGDRVVDTGATNQALNHRDVQPLKAFSDVAGNGQAIECLSVDHIKRELGLLAGFQSRMQVFADRRSGRLIRNRVTELRD